MSSASSSPILLPSTKTTPTALGSANTTKKLVVKVKKEKAPLEETVLNIRELDLNSIPPFTAKDNSGTKIVVIGKAGVGKSTVIQALLASKAHLAPVIQVFNGTEESNGSYSSKCPGVFVYDKLDLNAMIQFKNRQTIAGKHIPENPWAIQVIDDCTDDPKQLRHPIFQAYYKNGRHWHMIHILSLQYSLDIMPNIRSNIDYTFIMRESSKKNRKKLYENYCPDCVETQEDFNALMDALTGDYGALVVCNRTTSNKIEDCIFYFKAEPNAISPAFKFGHQSAWEFNAERFDPNYVEPIISG
jgi:hypothetical protein